MRVISNSAISLDGRINTPEDRPIMLGSEHDRQKMKELRQTADAILIGGATFRHWPTPLLPATEGAGVEAEPRPRPIWNVIVTRRLDMELRPQFLREPSIRPLFLAPAASVRSDFPAEVESYSGPGPDIPISWILEVLARRGIETLLVEAGGDLLYQFLAADALDEMFITLCPLLIGGCRTAGLVGGAGFSPAELRRLELQSLELGDDEIFLHYRVKKS